jgi:hypothetical protein
MPPSLVPDLIDEWSSSLMLPYPITSTSWSSDSDVELYRELTVDVEELSDTERRL